MNQKKFGLNQLAVKIANENEELLTKLDLWGKLKEEYAPMSDRMEVAWLDEKIVKMIYRSLFYDYSNTSLYMLVSIHSKEMNFLVDNEMEDPHLII